LANRLLSLAREPLLQFLLIGACIYALYGWAGTPADEGQDSAIVVDAARVEAFVDQWAKRWNRPPTRQELDGVIDAYVRDEILYRQAVAMGLDQDDPVTRRRMAQKLEFLTSDIALLREPAPGELEQYLENNQARFRDPDLISFRHVFFDPDLRDESIFDAADAALSRLRAAADPDAAALGEGDRFLSQSEFSEAAPIDVRRQLGSGFADALIELEPRLWQGPVLSGFGVHLVYVHEILEAPPAKLEDVRQVVLEDWQRVQQDQFNEEFYQSLKSRYEVVIAEPPTGKVFEVPASGAGETTRASAEPPADVPAS
jgi:hypothetical protein